ncbi:MAG TPA: hypothetical protein ENK66_06705 [Arcobacter sp.]|jgi:hypothetical protein|nr:hypothetical protein [Arcobacter sp.]
MKNQLFLTKQLFFKLFNKLNENKISLLKSLSLSIGILVIANYYFVSIDEGSDTVSIYASFFSMFILIVVYPILAINIHRTLLLGSNSIPFIGIYTLSKREIKYLFYLIGLYVFILFISVLPMLIGVFFVSNEEEVESLEYKLFAFIFSFILYYLLARFSLIFPSIAIDKAISFNESWEYTKKYQILVIIGLVLFPLFIDQLLETISHNLIYSFVYFIESIFIIGILSLIYEYIISNTVNFEDRELEEIKIIEYEKMFKVKIDNRYEISFELLKDEINNQYTSLSYTKNVVDNDNTWMIKKSDDGNSYVSVNKDKHYFYIEIFNTVKPNLDFLNNFNLNPDI